MKATSNDDDVIINDITKSTDDNFTEEFTAEEFSITSTPKFTMEETEATSIADETESSISNTYYEANLNKDVNNLITDISGKFYLSDDAVKNSYIVMNIDNIVTSNQSLLSDVFKNGQSADKFIQDYNNYSSLMREYNSNIKNVNEFLSFDIEYNDNDKAIIGELENLAKQIYLSTDANEINSLFDKVYAFAEGTGSLTIDGVDYTVENLSVGGGMMYTEPLQLVQIWSKDYVSDEKREKLAKLSGNNIDASESKLTTLLNTFAQTPEKILEENIDNYISPITEDGQIYVDAFDDFIKNTVEELNQLGIDATEEEVKSTVILLNLDYLKSDSMEKAIYATITDGMNASDILNNSVAFVGKSEKYNSSINKSDDLYSYQNLFITDKDSYISDKVTIAGITEIQHSLLSEITVTSTDAELLTNKNYVFLKSYNAYDSEAAFTYNDQKYVKNSVTAGASYLENLIQYYYVGITLSADNDIVARIDPNNYSLTDGINVYELLDEGCSGLNLDIKQGNLTQGNQKVKK
jgi:hypothetical protein